MAEIWIHEGESIENALRRFKRKVMQEDIIKEFSVASGRADKLTGRPVKKHSFYMKPGEKKRVEQALGRKRSRKKVRRQPLEAKVVNPPRNILTSSKARSAYTASMAKKIYVGNLSVQTTETDLGNMFGESGQVESLQIITDRDTGRSKGFGFVQMADDAAAEKAIAQLNGKEVGGRNLTVNEARPMHKRDFGSRGGGGGGRRY